MSIEIIAPMPGKIASIPVSVGSQVKESKRKLVIMDAMKMEILSMLRPLEQLRRLKLKRVTQ